MLLPIRDGAVEDANALSELRSASILELTRGFYSDEERIAWSRNRKAEDFLHVLRTGEQRIRCAILDGQIVGFACLNDNAIWGLHVQPDRTKRGIGTLIINDLESLAQEARLRTLLVAASLNAVSLYTRLGYEVYASSHLEIKNPLSGLCITLAGLSMMKSIEDENDYD
jgi:putative acetyltransferase